jgi:hypothetical protein
MEIALRPTSVLPEYVIQVNVQVPDVADGICDAQDSDGVQGTLVLLVLVITVVDVLPKAAVIVWVKLLLAVLIVMVPALPSAMEPQLIDDARGMVANVTEPETDPDFSDHADVVAFVVKDADTGNV